MRVPEAMKNGYPGQILGSLCLHKEMIFLTIVFHILGPRVHDSTWPMTVNRSNKQQIARQLKHLFNNH